MQNCWQKVQEQHPLILNLTNYVTVNQVANILLAAGAVPLMSDEIQEIPELIELAQGVNINLGTLNQRTIPAMFLAAQTAVQKQKVLVLDAAGAGASQLRTQTALKLVRENQFTVIRGNISEIKALGGKSSPSQGVNAHLADLITFENLPQTRQFINQLAAQTGSIIAVSGALDLVGNNRQCYVLQHGRPEMSRITGTGCQLSGLIAAFVAANHQEPLKAAAAATALMGLAGEIAWQQLQPHEGNATYGQRLIDAVYCFTEKNWKDGVKYELY